MSRRALYSTRLVPENALEIVRGFDIVADGSDNFATRYLVNDACYFAKRPLVFAAVGPFDGHLTTFRALRDATRPANRARLIAACFPEPPPEGTVAPCAEAGILGAVAGVIGTLAAVEVVKELLGIGESLVGRLLLYDALAARFTTVAYALGPREPAERQRSRASMICRITAKRRSRLLDERSDPCSSYRRKPVSSKKLMGSDPGFRLAPK